MKVIFHLTMDDIIGYGCVAIVLVLIILFMIKIGIDNLIAKFKKWKEKTFGKKNNDNDEAGSDK